MILPKIIKLKEGEQLKLTNDGNLSIFWLGVGSAFSKKLYQTNPLIIKGQDHVLIDCGTRCSNALFEYGLPLTEIENVLITHSHADHVGGLEEMALMGRYFVKRKPKIIITEEYENILWQHSLKGGCSFNEKKDGKYLDFIDLFDPIRPKKIKEKPRQMFETNCGSINLKIFRTMHIPDNSKGWFDSFLTYGVLIDNKVLFTSDTRYDPDLIYYFYEKFESVEYIIHDTQLFTGGVHAGYNELLEYPEKIRENMLLVHYGDNFDQFNPEKDGFLGFVKQGHYYIFE